MRIPLLLVLSLGLASAQSDKAKEELAYSIGVQAYIYGLAPNIVQLTRDQAAPPELRNRFQHASSLATHLSKAIVAPNNDTLYSSAWLDLSKDAMLLHVPAMKRYHNVHFLDAYTNNFAYAGLRVDGPNGGDYVIHGPAWRGKIPSGARVIAAPTNTVWVLVRILVDGSDDIPNVTELQKRLTLKPLNGSAAPAPASGSPVGGKPVVPVVNAMNAQEYFGTLANAITENRPPARDEAILKQFERIGLKPGTKFDFEKLDAATQRGLTRALPAGREIVVSAAVTRVGAPVRNGWRFPVIHEWGTDYLLRAGIALMGLGALDPEEAIYPYANSDFIGQPLTGSNRYVLRFEKAQMPPVNAFWSLTMYDQSRYLVENPISRYSIGDRTKGLQYEPDGSLNIYVQHDKPAGKESNWLPSPDGPFNFTLRLYLPKPQAVDGTWAPPKLLPSGSTDTWNRFRGPNGSGISNDTGFPTVFNKEKNVAWRTKVRPGKSSPVLTKTRIFLTAAENRKLYTQCFDRQTGKLLWEQSIDQPRTETANKLNHEASPSPVTDGENVYVFFKDYGVLSYDGQGKLRWKAPLGPFASTMGVGTSPILNGDDIYILADQWEGSFLGAFNRNSGEMRFKASREEADSWGSPLLYQPKGASMRILTTSRGQLGLHQASDGKRVYTLLGLMTTVVGSPVIDKDVLYVFGYGSDTPQPFTQRLERFDKNKDGRITPDEYGDDPILNAVGKRAGNRDGIVTEDKWTVWNQKVAGPNFLAAYKLEGDSAKEMWRYDKSYSLVVPSPLVYQDVVYTVRNGGILTALDAPTGNVRKNGRMEGALGGYSSSPVAAEGKLYIASEEGKVVVLKAAGDWEVLQVNDLGEGIFATPALSQGVIYVRTDESLYAFH